MGAPPRRVRGVAIKMTRWEATLSTNKDSSWDEGFAALTKFKAREGHCRVTRFHVERMSALSPKANIGQRSDWRWYRPGFGLTNVRLWPIAPTLDRLCRY